MENKKATKTTAYKIWNDSFDNKVVGIWLLLNDNRLIRIRFNNIYNDEEFGRAEIDSHTIIGSLACGDSVESIYKRYKLKTI